MKRFFNIRSLLISLVLLIVVIALIYIFVIRSCDIGNSKTSKLYYDLVNRNVVTMTLEFKEDELSGNIIYSTDNKNKKTTIIIEAHDMSESGTSMHTNSVKTISINENGESKFYSVNYDLKRYNTTNIGKEDYDANSWIRSLIKSAVDNSKYYTKGYETINSENLFVETFEKDNTKYYYDGDNLKYIENLDGSTKGTRRLYSVKIENSFVDKSLTEIPSNFELVDVMDERRIEDE